MKRWTILFSSLFVVIISGAAAFLYWMHRGSYLEQAERELNRLYKEHRPFVYRWKGAPASGSVTDECHIPPAATQRAAIAIESAEQRFGRTFHVLQLSGRLALLQGRLDDAIAAYHRASYLSSDNPEIKLELGIAYAERARCEHRPLDYEFAMEQMLALEAGNPSDELTFDLAAVLASIPLPNASLDRWSSVIRTEPSTEWRNEAYWRLAKVQSSLMSWDQRLHQIGDSPNSYLAHATQAGNSIETVVAAALESWINSYYSDATTDSALRALAAQLKAEYHDSWLFDLLQTPDSPAGRLALQHLSLSWKANSHGRHHEAEQLALSAEELFREVGNVAGTLRARVERAFSLERRSLTQNCLHTLHDLRPMARSHGYVWIDAQARLEEITCLSQSQTADVIRARETAFQEIAGTKYEGLRLRALSFLTEDFVCFGSRLTQWQRGMDGVLAFWQSALPALRVQSFYFSLASSARRAGNGHAAVVLLTESLQAAELSGYKSLIALLSADLGAWESEIGQYNASIRAFDQMSENMNGLRATDKLRFWREAEITRAGAEVATGHPQQAIERLNKLLNGSVPPHSDFPQFVLRRLFRALGDAHLALSQLRMASNEGPDLNLAIASGYYRSAVTTTEKKLRSVHDRVQRENIEQEIGSAWRGLSEIELRNGNVSQSLKIWEDFRNSRIRTATAAPLRPPDKGTLVVFAFLPGGLSAWALDTNGIEQRWINGKEAIQKARQFSKLVTDRDSPVAFAAHDLYALLLEPIAARSPQNGNLIIDADGPLAGIPWAALESAPGHPLLERFSFSQANGWSSMAPSSNKNTRIFVHSLIVGEPTVGLELIKQLQLPALADAKGEAQWLHRHLPGSILLAGASATFENFARNIGAATFLHFAGHGVSNGGFGAILLAPASGGLAPARLVTASELSQLDLARLRLVVLASCSSGSGENSGEVNLDSLVRGFLQAGILRVVAARWNIDSAQTAQLMSRFYEGMLKGLSAEESLQQATLVIQRNPALRHPYHWAAFQVFGSSDLAKPR